MWKYTIQVDGMMCGMCESHVNDAVRKAFPVKKVTSSRSKKETVVITETELFGTQINGEEASGCWQNFCQNRGNGHK